MESNLFNHNAARQTVVSFDTKPLFDCCDVDCRSHFPSGHHDVMTLTHPSSFFVSVARRITMGKRKRTPRVRQLLILSCIPCVVSFTTRTSRRRRSIVVPSTIVLRSTTEPVVAPVNGDSSSTTTAISAEDLNEDTSMQLFDDNPFQLVAMRAAICLYKSDMKRDAIGKPGKNQPSSATNWIHDASAFSLQKTCDSIQLKVGRIECAHFPFMTSD